MPEALVERIRAQGRGRAVEVRVARERLVGLVLVVDPDGQRDVREGRDFRGEVERHLAAGGAQGCATLIAEEVEALRELLGRVVVD